MWLWRSQAWWKKYCYYFVRWAGYANQIAAYVIMFMLID